MASSPLSILLPLVAAMTYGPWFASLLQHRYVAYERLRRDGRRALVARYLLSALSSFLTFWAIGMVPWLMIDSGFGDPSYDPGGYGIEPQNVFTEQLAWGSFTDFSGYGDFYYVLFCSCWMATYAAMYSVLTMVALLMLRRRVVALIAPWVLSLVAGLLVAVFAGPAYSPLSAFPFNMQQMPVERLAVPLATLTALATGGMAYTVARLERMFGMQ